MAVVPAAVAAGFTAPALAHFSDLLSRDARGASIKSRSLATLHKVRIHGLVRKQEVVVQLGVALQKWPVCDDAIAIVTWGMIGNTCAWEPVGIRANLLTKHEIP